VFGGESVPEEGEKHPIFPPNSPFLIGKVFPISNGTQLHV